MYFEGRDNSKKCRDVTETKMDAELQLIFLPDKQPRTHKTEEISARFMSTPDQNDSPRSF